MLKPGDRVRAVKCHAGILQRLMQCPDQHRVFHDMPKLRLVDVGRQKLDPVMIGFPPNLHPGPRLDTI